MDDINKGLIVHLSQIIAKLAEGKIIVDEFTMNIQDHSVKQVFLDGSVRIQKGPVSRSITFEYMEVK